MIGINSLIGFVICILLIFYLGSCDINISEFILLRSYTKVLSECFKHFNDTGSITEP